MLQVIQSYYKVMSAIAPQVAGKQAFSLFQKTRTKKIREKEKQFYNLSRNFKIGNKPEDIDCYEMGKPSDKLILLVHGWESNTGSLGAIAIDLVEKGYHVVGFNLPAHGFSKLKKANIKVCRDYFLKVVSYLAPTTPFSVVAHSFGAAVTTFSLANTNYKVDKLVFLTNPNKVSDVFRQFQSIIKLGDKAYDHLIKNTESYLGKSISEYEIENTGDQLNYNKILLVHDKHDKILPFRNSEAVKEKWSNAELVELENIGHYRMLWNEHTVKSVGDFIESKENESVLVD